MRARAVQTSEVRESGTKSHKSLDAQLSGHLQQAEHHLIQAALIFEKEPKLRTKHYIDRLHRAQETTTGLMMEELVRIRDSKKRKPKKVKVGDDA